MHVGHLELTDATASATVGSIALHNVTLPFDVLNLTWPTSDQHRSDPRVQRCLKEAMCMSTSDTNDVTVDVPIGTHALGFDDIFKPLGQSADNH